MQSLALLLLAANGAYSIGERCLSGYLCQQIFFQTTTPVLLQFLKLGTYDLHANVQITVEQIFERLILKFLAIFFQTTPSVFVRFSRNLAHMIYVPLCKKLGEIFKFRFK